jgi:hypothetical protein
MWEVRAADGRSTELLSWVSAHADPNAQIFLSEPDSDEVRVVVIAADVETLAAVPVELVARPAHAWPFRQVRGG